MIRYFCTPRGNIYFEIQVLPIEPSDGTFRGDTIGIEITVPLKQLKSTLQHWGHVGPCSPSLHSPIPKNEYQHHC